jgi:hypothetical protein
MHISGHGQIFLVPTGLAQSGRMAFTERVKRQQKNQQQNATAISVARLNSVKSRLSIGRKKWPQTICLRVILFFGNFRIH